jgi:glycosyltransferase involved in cell wall biosynthesis
VAAALLARDGEHLLLGETTADLAAAAVTLLRDGARARRMADAAHALVTARYGWDASAAAVENAWADAVRGNTP